MVSNVWQGLWWSHDQTKKLLNFFSYKKDTKDAKKKNKQLNEAENNGDSSPNPEQHPQKKSYSTAQIVGLILGPLLFILTLLFFSPEGLTSDAKAVLAVTWWVATWWGTEAVPIPVASLLSIVVSPCTA